jgi:hypothetical protein
MVEENNTRLKRSENGRHHDTFQSIVEATCPESDVSGMASVLPQ